MKYIVVILLNVMMLTLMVGIYLLFRILGLDPADAIILPFTGFMLSILCQYSVYFITKLKP